MRNVAVPGQFPARYVVRTVHNGAAPQP